MAYSLAGLLALAGGALPAAEVVPPARGYPQVPAYEPVFVSASKPLPVPPATITKPIAIPSIDPVVMPVAAPKASTTAPVAAPVEPTRVVTAAQVVETPQINTPTVSDALKDYQIILEPPSREELFGRLDSEPMLEKRMRQQAMQRNPPDTVQFPDKPVVSRAQYKPRSFPPAGIFSEPLFVCHDRLYCEERNAERYGWNLGVLQPLISFGYFYRDAAFMPLVFISRPLQRFDTSAGKCLPGDPVPYLIYPLALSAPVKGAAFGLIAALP